MCAVHCIVEKRKVHVLVRLKYWHGIRRHSNNFWLFFNNLILVTYNSVVSLFRALENKAVKNMLHSVVFFCEAFYLVSFYQISMSLINLPRGVYNLFCYDI